MIRDIKLIKIQVMKMINCLRNFVEKHGRFALQRARESILSEHFDCKKIEDAMQYFMNEYWQNYTTPTLLFLAHEAVGGDSERLLNLASAMIIVSGGIDIHDDVVDNSKQKDGRVTVYGKFGKEVALLVGDSLLVKGLMMFWEACQGFGIRRALRALEYLKKGLFELGEAEVSELGFRGRLDVKPKEYLRVMHKKAADVEALMRIGALLASADDSQIEILGKYGRIVGYLSILRDDVLDMIVLEEFRQRVKYECLPLPLLYALNDYETKTNLIELLAKKRITRRDFEKISYLTKKAHGFRKTQKCLNEQRRRGTRLLNKLTKKVKELQLIIDGLANLEIINNC